GFSFSFPEVVQLCPPDSTSLQAFDAFDHRRIKRENSLYAVSERHLSHSKGGLQSSLLHSQDDAFECLNTELIAFLDLDVHTHRISWTKLRNLLIHIFFRNDV